MIDKHLLTSKNPELIIINKVGNSALGYISIAENLPFDIKRVYWTYYAPHDVIRGMHAHKNLFQLIIAISGIIEFKVENRTGELFEFKLDQPNLGLFIPPLCWREMKFSHNAVLLCLASLEYSEDDYIRNYSAFKKLVKK
jgi:dTDP-4-dehydrorhamnose 3,5-epimerase-like enzyme